MDTKINDRVFDFLNPKYHPNFPPSVGKEVIDFALGIVTTKELREKIATANTSEECLDVYKESPYGSRNRALALRKALTLAKDHEEYIHICTSHYYSRAARDGLKKLNAKINKGLEQIKTAERFWAAYEHYVEYSYRDIDVSFDRKNVQKALSFAREPWHYEVVYFHAPAKSLAKNRAFKELVGFYSNKLKSALTIEECEKICDVSCRYGMTVVKKGAIEKAFTLAKTMEECWKIYRWADGKLKRSARENAFARSEAILLLELEVESLKTVDEYIEYCKKAARYVNKWKLVKVLKRAIDISTSPEECEGLINEFDWMNYSPLTHYAIKKLAKLLSEKGAVV